MYNTFEKLFQEFGLLTSIGWLLVSFKPKIKGLLLSNMVAVVEHPGSPLSQMMRGSSSLVSLFLDSKRM
jgi:hypothetical protein